MKLLINLSILIILSSCAAKRALLSSNEYNLKDKAKLTVNFLKLKKKAVDIGLVGISTTENGVVIKKTDLECGIGDQIGKISKIEKVTNEPFIILTQNVFKEFIIICRDVTPATNADENVYLKIKNLYALKNGSPDKVIASDIKIEFK